MPVWMSGLSDLKALRRALTRRSATYALLASLSAIALLPLAVGAKRRNVTAVSR
jgi:hypothetical protein